MKLRVLCVLACLLTVVPAYAEDEVRYLPLKPTFVTNFGQSSSGRLKYLKADVSVRIGSGDAERDVRYHLPAIRNALVLLFSRQDVYAITTAEGRLKLKEDALETVRMLMEKLVGAPTVDSLMFETFVVQL